MEGALHCCSLITVPRTGEMSAGMHGTYSRGPLWTICVGLGAAQADTNLISGRIRVSDSANRHGNKRDSCTGARPEAAGFGRTPG